MDKRLLLDHQYALSRRASKGQIPEYFRSQSLAWGRKRRAPRLLEIQHARTNAAFQSRTWTAGHLVVRAQVPNRLRDRHLVIGLVFGGGGEARLAARNP